MQVCSWISDILKWCFFLGIHWCRTESRVLSTVYFSFAPKMNLGTTSSVYIFLQLFSCFGFPLPWPRHHPISFSSWSFCLATVIAPTRLPRWYSDKESSCQCRRCRRHAFDPWVRKIPWRRKWQPTPVFLSGESHGQRSLVGNCPWGRRVRHG